MLVDHKKADLLTLVGMSCHWYLRARRHILRQWAAKLYRDKPRANKTAMEDEKNAQEEQCDEDVYWSATQAMQHLSRITGYRQQPGPKTKLTLAIFWCSLDWNNNRIIKCVSHGAHISIIYLGISLSLRWTQHEHTSSKAYRFNKSCACIKTYSATVRQDMISLSSLVQHGHIAAW